MVQKSESIRAFLLCLSGSNPDVIHFSLDSLPVLVCSLSMFDNWSRKRPSALGTKLCPYLDISWSIVHTKLGIVENHYALPVMWFPTMHCSFPCSYSPVGPKESLVWRLAPWIAGRHHLISLSAGTSLSQGMASFSLLNLVWGKLIYFLLSGSPVDYTITIGLHFFFSAATWIYHAGLSKTWILVTWQ